jgi:hypothetical protein
MAETRETVAAVEVPLMTARWAASTRLTGSGTDRLGLSECF